MTLSRQSNLFSVFLSPAPSCSYRTFRSAIQMRSIEFVAHAEYWGETQTHGLKSIDNDQLISSASVWSWTISGVNALRVQRPNVAVGAAALVRFTFNDMHIFVQSKLCCGTNCYDYNYVVVTGFFWNLGMHYWCGFACRYKCYTRKSKPAFWWLIKHRSASTWDILWLWHVEHIEINCLVRMRTLTFGAWTIHI